MLAHKIGADQIEAGAVSAGTLETTNLNGSVNIQGGQLQVLDSNGKKRVYIHPGDLEMATSVTGTVIFNAPPSG